MKLLRSPCAVSAENLHPVRQFQRSSQDTDTLGLKLQHCGGIEVPDSLPMCDRRSPQRHNSVTAFA